MHEYQAYVVTFEPDFICFSLCLPMRNSFLALMGDSGHHGQPPVVFSFWERSLLSQWEDEPALETIHDQRLSEPALHPSSVHAQCSSYPPRTAY